jgi:hypothetical protein
MGVAVIVGTAKGAILLSSEDRERWETSPLLLKGWIVTAAARDEAGRTYVAVTHDVWGACIMASDDLESWDQLEAAPRYAAGLSGNESHLRVVGAMDPMGQFKDGGRYVDQIWKLHAAHGSLYAGVSEAGLFRSQDRGKTWQVAEGLDQHETRPDWGAGFGGLCAHSVLTDANDPDRIWVGISAAGVFRSDDGGRTFAPKNEGVSRSEGYCVHSLAHDPTDADVIYRQDHRGVYRTRDAGDSWQLIENGLPSSELGDGHRCSFGFPIQMDPASGRIFVVPMEGDSYRFPERWPSTGRARAVSTSARRPASSTGVPTGVSPGRSLPDRFRRSCASLRSRSSDGPFQSRRAGVTGVRLICPGSPCACRVCSRRSSGDSEASKCRARGSARRWPI